jgi:competence protein ComEC
MVRWFLVLALILGGGGALRATAYIPHELSVTALDVGQGDATLVDAGLAVLVDTGIPGSQAAEKAAAHGSRVVALIVTHLERDHAGDVAAAIRTARPAAVFWNGRTDAPLYEELRKAAAAADVPLIPLGVGDVLRAGEATYRVIWPNLAYRTSANHNDSSLVIRAELPGFSALLTGDIPEEVELHLPADAVDADVLKVGHHGSKNSSGDAFLAAVSPTISLISAGKGNRYGHPAPEALERLEAAGSRVRRTDLEGDLRVTAHDVRAR